MMMWWKVDGRDECATDYMSCRRAAAAAMLLGDNPPDALKKAGHCLRFSSGPHCYVCEVSDLPVGF